jgi:hypothetical protein
MRRLAPQIRRPTSTSIEASSPRLRPNSATWFLRALRLNRPGLAGHGYTAFSTMRKSELKKVDREARKGMKYRQSREPHPSRGGSFTNAGFPVHYGASVFSDPYCRNPL